MKAFLLGCGGNIRLFKNLARLEQQDTQTPRMGTIGFADRAERDKCPRR